MSRVRSAHSHDLGNVTEYSVPVAVTARVQGTGRNGEYRIKDWHGVPGWKRKRGTGTGDGASKWAPALTEGLKHEFLGVKV
jgi:hypothetical protein